MPTSTGADDVPLHHDDHPGPDGPVLALAGGAARHPDYLATPDGRPFGLTRRVVVPHLRGVSLSPAPADPERGSWWRQAEDVDRLREHLGLERVTIVAHSAGTRLAVAYAAQHPERVERMVLVTPPAGYLVDVPSDVDAMVARRTGEPDFDAAVTALTSPPEITSDAELAAWQATCAPAGYARWGAAERAHSRVGEWSLAGSRAYFSVAPPADLAERLAAVTAPVLVVAGSEDVFTGRAPLAAMSRLFPDGDLAVVDRCGHYPWVEQPHAFTALVGAFLERP
ncbi:alpha/beta fold hydrolase [Sanguibacter suaedae]|uniref:Alpha/beta hydrolase n=1 Tax=Sanguibacter suaedae TaxID=2795737 RepID=A0A934M5Y1_9MICO|nr:alpha/beta hydrolase [Sanguibacter suaedae]MBI9113622.1 alpha/beta hydrolase [Sanguibacter suaedae]